MDCSTWNNYSLMAILAQKGGDNQIDKSIKKLYNNKINFSPCWRIFRKIIDCNQKTGIIKEGIKFGPIVQRQNGSMAWIKSGFDSPWVHKKIFLNLILTSALVAQWIELIRPKDKMWVRFLPSAQLQAYVKQNSL